MWLSTVLASIFMQLHNHFCGRRILWITMNCSRQMWCKRNHNFILRVKMYINREVHFMCILVSTRIRYRGHLGKQVKVITEYTWSRSHCLCVRKEEVAVPKTACALVRIFKLLILFFPHWCIVWSSIFSGVFCFP